MRRADVLSRAQVGKPVPGEHALDGHHHFLAVGGNGAQEVSGVGVAVLVVDALPVGAENAELHTLGMQIDPAVVSVLLCVEAHPVSSFAPRWGVGCLVAANVPRRLRREEAWMSIKRMQRTRKKDARG